MKIIICLMLSTISLHLICSQEKILAEQSNVCKSAKLTQKIKLENSQKTKVIVSSRPLSEEYLDAPSGRTEIYTFVLDGKNAGNKVYDIANSPLFAKSIATKITQSCAQVGLVVFVAQHTDYFVKYGIFSNGDVKQFKCEEGDRRQHLNESPKWGTQVCL